jgi:type I restriction enzyme M protein
MRKTTATILALGIVWIGYTVETIAEDLLATFRAAPLLDAYDVYQHLMDYWAETMQDDCYLIAVDGWHEASQPRLIVEDKNKKTKSRPDFCLG